MTDNWYHGSSTNQVNQAILYRNGDLVDAGFIFVTGLDAHLNLLEDFSPVRTVDVFRWIPYGLYNDMMDNRNDVLFARVLLDDQVSNYTNQQFFNALESDIRSLPSFKARLLSQNGNNQAAGVNTIFTFYGY